MSISIMTQRWTEKLGQSLIKSVSVSVGGGEGDECTKCGQFKKSTNICLNKISVLNVDKVTEIIREYITEINDNTDYNINLSDNNIKKYIDEKNYINEIFNLLLDHYGNEGEAGKYNDLVDKICYENYYDGIYEEQLCHNDYFEYKKHSGTVIDKQNDVWLTVWHELCGKGKWYS